MKTGLFFGSFNPIHTGHLIIAQYMLNEAKLDKIKFVVSPHNPLKTGLDLMDANLRIKMTEMSIADNNRFELEPIEYQLPLPSYTSHTLSELKKLNPDDEFFIIMGSDNLESIEKWKDFETILNYPILVYKRKKDFENPFPERPGIVVFDCPILNISATTIRKMITQNQSIKYLVRDEIISVLKKEL